MKESRPPQTQKVVYYKKILSKSFYSFLDVLWKHPFSTFLLGTGNCRKSYFEIFWGRMPKTFSLFCLRMRCGVTDVGSCYMRDWSLNIFLANLWRTFRKVLAIKTYFHLIKCTWLWSMILWILLMRENENFKRVHHKNFSISIHYLYTIHCHEWFFFSFSFSFPGQEKPSLSKNTWC